MRGWSCTVAPGASGLMGCELGGRVGAEDEDTDVDQWTTMVGRGSRNERTVVLTGLISCMQLSAGRMGCMFRLGAHGAVRGVKQPSGYLIGQICFPPILVTLTLYIYILTSLSGWLTLIAGNTTYWFSTSTRDGRAEACLHPKSTIKRFQFRRDGRNQRVRNQREQRLEPGNTCNGYESFGRRLAVPNAWENISIVIHPMNERKPTSHVLCPIEFD
jgi:hypothetical protein